MSSAVNLSATTSTSSNLPNLGSASANGANRPAMRSSSSVKTGEGARKSSPVDTASRRPPQSQKAWTSGTNPLTQRGSTPSQPNGSISQSKSVGSTKSTAQRDGGVSDKHAHDRLNFLLGATLGLSVMLTTKTGDKYEGLLSGSTSTANNTKVTLKMTKRLSAASSGQVNGIAGREAAFAGSSPDYAMNFDLRDMADIAIPGFTLPEVTKAVNGTGSTFQTDADISGNANRAERTLQRWIPDGPEDIDLSLESSTAGDWDQFDTNRQLFGANSTYDENIYTTAIDRSAPSYRRREAEAARIAREIEGTTSVNAHIREERGHAPENDGEDEEDKYSGVRRDDRTFPPLPVGGPNKYTPPARRPPTGQPTVAGAPVDSAIISAQLSTSDSSKAAATKNKIDIVPNTPEVRVDDIATASTSNDPAETLTKSTPAVTPATPKAQQFGDKTSATRGNHASASPHRDAPAEGTTDNIPHQLLSQFRQFANAERTKLVERKKAQASHDRTAKLNELLRFSKTFKLNTPVPGDLVGILAKDPAKQEAIIEKAQKEHEDSKSAAASPSTPSKQGTPVRSFDASQVPPPIPDRQTFNRGRGGFPQAGARSAQPQQALAGRSGNPNLPARPAGTLPEKKPSQPLPIPAPIPIVEGRVPPLGPMADQAGLASPLRSNLHTPTSTVSSKFNLNVKASEFRPNATAPAFNPTASSNAPSSPASVPRTSSVSRAASPSTFFGARKPKVPSERPSITHAFNPIKRMKEEVATKVAQSAKVEDGQKEKDYSANGGIPNAYSTGPVWTVRQENSEKTYAQAFERPSVALTSPAQSRAASAQHIPYQNQLPQLSNGAPGIAPISTPHHGLQPNSHHYPHHYDDSQQRMHMGAGSQMYPSPSTSGRQISAYASPMGHPAQLAYAQPSYFGAPPGQMPIQMRQYPGTPGMMHAQAGQMHAPMMVQQQSNGSYMQLPQQYNPQMQMYSPNPGHVYPQQNGYNSPGRMAPVMMQQNSQQGHHPAQPMMYTMSAQGGPMGYQQTGQMARGGYAGHQYGSSPHQPYQMQQRTMSSGYGQIPQKMMAQHMGHNQGPPLNAPQQPAAFGQVELAQDEGK